MKNELGIEVKCDNCYLKFDCNLPIENACRINGQHLSFMPSIEACSTRIKELKEQQFTWNARNHSEIPNSSIGEKIIDAIIENKLFSVINPRTNKEIKKTLVVWSSATNEILEAVVAEEICKQHKTEEE